MHGLSMIVPIYNVEKYLEKCLESVIDSMGSFTNVQIILVDDGSEDGSGEIAKRYAAIHPQLLYLKKENGGLSDARNFGLRYVEYAYVSFLDSDDYITQDYFSKIFEALQEKPDLIVFDWYDIIENQNSKKVKGMDFEEVIWSIQPSAWNKVYKTSLFEEVEFPVGKIYEDVGTVYKLLYYTKSYIYLNSALYNYRKNRQGSILSTVSSKNNDLYNALEDTYSFYSNKESFIDGNKEGLCYQYVKLLVWSDMYRQLQSHKLDFWGFYKKMRTTRGIIYTRFPEWKNNNYLNRNTFYFKSRLGSNYVAQLDRIGKSPFVTLRTLIFLIVKNMKRTARVAS